MKKWLLCILLLCGCSNQGAYIEDSDGFSIHVKISEGSLFGLHEEHYIDGHSVGGGIVNYRNHHAFVKGDDIDFDFLMKDFPSGSNMSLFEIEFFMIDQFGSEVLCQNKISMDVSVKKDYDVDLSVQDSVCSVTRKER